MTTTPADRRYDTARAIADGIPDAVVRSMPALDVAFVDWTTPTGARVLVTVGTHAGETTVDADIHGLDAGTLTVALAAIAAALRGARAARVRVPA